ncbi:MAG: ribosome biogenesis GTPase Der [Alphaproteobacteria bacterium]
MGFTLAIVGRPNVGKSTLFNRLVGGRVALVADVPGVTRDRREGEGRIGPMRFTVIDTAGLAEAPPESTAQRMQKQTERAVAAADVTLLMIDGRAGITPDDRHFARALRKTQASVVLVVNKCEGGAGDEGFYDAFGLGLGDPVAISAEHGEGLNTLYEALLPYASDEESETAAGAEAARPLKLAIVGRPNVGKSTLLNRLVGEERTITGPEPGITRDAIAVEWEHEGRAVRLVDTAGLRRRARVVDALEKMSTADSLRVVRGAEVVVLMLDAETPLERQDLTIGRIVVEEGRALVVAVNKWDLIADGGAVLGRLRERLAEALPQARGVPVVTLSALTGRGAAKLMPAVFAAYDHWNARIETARLNRWLDGALAAHAPPAVAGRRLKLRYATQVKARPPTFAVFVNRPDAFPDSYLRYLENRLRDAFDLPGVPIRLLLRAGKNPYAGRKKAHGKKR